MTTAVLIPAAINPSFAILTESTGQLHQHHHVLIERADGLLHLLIFGAIDAQKIPHA